MNIAVTGGMGSGKSVVAQMLAGMFGVKEVSADHLCRDLLQVEQPGWKAMCEHFSPDFFLPDREINRPLLRTVIFSDPLVREQLDALLHPLVRDEIVCCLQAAAAAETDLVVEVPLLFEKQ